MPIGLSMNYVVFKKARLEQARAAALARNDVEAAEYVGNLILTGIRDEHLVGAESMSPFEDADLTMWTKRLELTWYANDDCVDFYLPSAECARATWLEQALINDMPTNANKTPMPIWDGFRLVGDKSRCVQVDDLCTRRPVDFPKKAATVGPENFEGLDWDVLLKTSPEWAKWRPV
jgi:hypothetical protein